MACYEAEFEPLPVDPEEGVPLEHLVSCVKGVLIQQGVTGIKSIIAVGGGGGEDDVSHAYLFYWQLANFPIPREVAIVLYRL